MKPLPRCFCALQLQGKAPAGLLLLHSPLWKCPTATRDISHGCAALYCHVMVLVTTAHASPCHGFGKVSPIGTWDPNSCCGPVRVCLGSAGAWGVTGCNLLSCSNAIGCTRTAELLPRKGLLSPLPGSRAVTSFRDGAAPAPHPTPVCPAFLAERGQPHGSALPCKGEGPEHGCTQQFPLFLVQVTRKLKKTEQVS